MSRQTARQRSVVGTGNSTAVGGRDRIDFACKWTTRKNSAKFMDDDQCRTKFCEEIRAINCFKWSKSNNNKNKKNRLPSTSSSLGLLSLIMFHSLHSYLFEPEGDGVQRQKRIELSGKEQKSNFHEKKLFEVSKITNENLNGWKLGLSNFSETNSKCLLFWMVVDKVFRAAFFFYFF